MLGPYFAAILEELLSTVVPPPMTLADADFLYSIRAKVLVAHGVAEAEVQDV